MKTAAIIAECNPFHRGHEYLIRTVREKTGAERIVLLMSGDYVQRGVPAVTDRFVRAHMALRGGADLVLSYPTRFATASAEGFARHAVRMLEQLSVADTLAFGSESGDLAQLQETADFFAEENEAFQEEIRRRLKSGESFAKARALAAGPFGGVLSAPNNILAVEYLKEIRRSGCALIPFTVQRKTAADDGAPFAGASEIRAMMDDNPLLKGMEKEIPEAAYPVLHEDIFRYGSVKPDDLSLLLAERLMRAPSAAALTDFRDVPEEIAQAAFRERMRCAGFEAFSERLHTKNRTHAAVNRALLHIALGIDRRAGEEDMYYAQILGFRRGAEDLLHRMKENTSIPVLTKAADAEKVLPGRALELYEEEHRVSSLYGAIRAVKSGNPLVPEASRSPVIV